MTSVLNLTAIPSLLILECTIVFLPSDRSAYIIFIYVFAIKEWLFFISKPKQKHTCIMLSQYKSSCILFLIRLQVWDWNHRMTSRVIGTTKTNKKIVSVLVIQYSASSNIAVLRTGGVF